MKLIPIDNTEKPNGNNGKAPEPPAVTVSGSSFSLNNSATIELARIYGGYNYAIQIYVSECLNYVGFGVKPSDKQLSAPVKSISSRKVKDMLRLRFAISKLRLVEHDGVLVADVSEYKK